MVICNATILTINHFIQSKGLLDWKRKDIEHNLLYQMLILNKKAFFGYV